MSGMKLTILWTLAASAAAPAADPAAEVRAVFAARCAGCHGPALAKPKGRFGYVHDLARVAGNREMVVPGAPDESELWELVRRGEMPPEDSPTGPLTADQKEAIRTWIAAGAPAGELPSVAAASSAADKPPATSALAWSFRRFGRLHVVVVHFPIALLIAAAVGEAWSARRARRRVVGGAPLAPAVHYCVVLGAIGAVAAAALGWLDAWGGAGVGMPATLRLHRWLGTTTVGVAVVAAVLSTRDERRGVRSGWALLALLVAAVLVAATGHLGGTLVFGDDFFTAG
jgi:uncharacterized membrane protein/mono/diheme cytochrome c family protein